METIQAGSPSANDQEELDKHEDVTPLQLQDGERQTPPTQRKAPPTRDENTGLFKLGQSRRMSSRQRELEMQLATGTDGDESDPQADERPSLSSVRHFVRCSSHDIVDRDSGSSESSETPSAGATNVYEQKGVALPRRMSQSAGRRIQSATDRLIDQYTKDLTVYKHGNEHSPSVKSSQPVKVAREKFKESDGGIKRRVSIDRERELDEVRATIRRRTVHGETVIDADEDDGEARRRLNSSSSVAGDVKCRKSLGEIRSKLMARAHSESKHDKEATGKSEAIASDRIGRIRNDLQASSKPTDKSERAFVSPNSVKNTLNFYKNKFETRTDQKALISKPTIRRKSAAEVMASRRRATYGNENDCDRERSGSTVDTSLIDIEQIRAARDSYKKLESSKPDLTPVNKPTAKVINEDQVHRTMSFHRQRTDSLSEISCGGEQPTECLHDDNTSVQQDSDEVALYASRLASDLEGLGSVEAKPQDDSAETSDDYADVVQPTELQEKEDNIPEGGTDDVNEAASPDCDALSSSHDNSGLNDQNGLDSSTDDQDEADVDVAAINADDSEAVTSHTSTVISLKSTMKIEQAETNNNNNNKEQDQSSFPPIPQENGVDGHFNPEYL